MLALCSLSIAQAKPTQKQITSPDGTLKVTVTIADDVRWSVEDDGKSIIEPSQIAMQIGEGEVWGAKPILRKASVGKIDEVIPSPLYKKSEVENECTTLTLTFKGDYAIELRAYDNAAAYRFISTRKGDYTVKNEVSEFEFAGDNTVIGSYVKFNRKGTGNAIEKQYYNSFENIYFTQPMSKMDPERLMFLPVLVEVGGKKVCITESDLMSYPGMYLYNSDSNNTLEANFASFPDEVTQGGHNMLQGEVQTRKPYIAEVSGERSFPWRICIVADNDAELLDDDMVFRLSQPNAIGDTSWIKPGKVAWDWWNDWGLYGVDFEPGINNRTYEYYIDFAARNGIEYVILDEGWSVNKKADLMQVVPEIDVKHLCDYAKERGVGIVLWAGYWALDRDMDNVMKHYAEMGVKGYAEFANSDGVVPVTEELREFITWLVPNLLQQALTLISIAVMMFVINWKLTLLVIVPIPLLVVMFRVLHRFTHRLYHRQWQVESDAGTLMHDVFSGMRVVKTYGTEKREEERFAVSAKKIADISRRNELFWNMTIPFASFLLSFGEFAVLFFLGCELVGDPSFITSGNPNFTLGDLSQFLSFVAIIYQPIRWMAFVPRRISQAVTSLAKISELLDEEEFEEPED